MPASSSSRMTASCIRPFGRARWTVLSRAGSDGDKGLAVWERWGWSKRTHAIEDGPTGVKSGGAIEPGRHKGPWSGACHHRHRYRHQWREGRAAHGRGRGERPGQRRLSVADATPGLDRAAAPGLVAGHGRRPAPAHGRRRRQSRCRGRASGQMHGSVFLDDAASRSARPCSGTMPARTPNATRSTAASAASG